MDEHCCTLSWAPRGSTENAGCVVKMPLTYSYLHSLLISQRIFLSAEPDWLARQTRTPPPYYPLGIIVKVSNPSQDPPLSPKALNRELKYMYNLCIFNIKIKSQNLEMGLSKTRDHIQIKIKIGVIKAIKHILVPRLADVNQM